MRSRALESDLSKVELVDEEPIGLDMAFSPTVPGSDQPAIAVDGIERLFGNQGADDNFRKCAPQLANCWQSQHLATREGGDMRRIPAAPASDRPLGERMMGDGDGGRFHV